MNSIKRKSMILLTSVSAAVMAIAFIGAYFFVSGYFQDRLSDQVDDTTTMLGVVLQEPVFSYDDELSATILKSFVKLPFIQQIEATDHRGKFIAEAKSDKPAPDRDDVKVVNSAITRGDQKVGSLKITYRMDSNDSIVGAAKLLFIILAIIILAALQLVNLYVLNHYVIAPVNKVASALEAIAKGDGDLTMRLDINTNDEIGKLANAFDRFIANLQALIGKVVHLTDDLNQSADTIHASSGANRDDANKQKVEMEEVAAALQQLSHAIQSVSESASLTSEKTNDCNELAISGNRVVQKTVSDINNLGREISATSDEISELKSRSDHISTVLVVIKGIAEQTNLLALNAAIEAARAGEMGRGFAVVADEVRALAQRTQDSTAEIEEVIKDLQSSSENANRMMDATRTTLQQTIDESGQAIEALDSIIVNIRNINDMNAQVAVTTEEQNQVTSQLSDKVVAISGLSDSVAHNANESSSLTTKLNTVSKEIKQKLSVFRT